MELVLIGVAAFLTSGLTLFSGFGLGTILMPVFALFFPVPLAIAATAVVHFANNIFNVWADGETSRLEGRSSVQHSCRYSRDGRGRNAQFLRSYARAGYL